MGSGEDISNEIDYFESSDESQEEPIQIEKVQKDPDFVCNLEKTQVSKQHNLRMRKKKDNEE